MNCPECDGKTIVRETKIIELNKYRKRMCKNCGHRFYTEETVVEDISAFRYYWANYKAEQRAKK